MLEDVRRSLVYALGWMIVLTVAQVIIRVPYLARAAFVVLLGLVVFTTDLGFRRHLRRQADDADLL